MCNYQNPLKCNSSHIWADLKRHRCECELLFFSPCKLGTFMCHKSWYGSRRTRVTIFCWDLCVLHPGWQESCHGLLRHSMRSGKRSGPPSHNFHNTLEDFQLNKLGSDMRIKWAQLGKKKIPPYTSAPNGKADCQRKVRVLEEQFLQKTQKAKHWKKIHTGSGMLPWFLLHPRPCFRPLSLSLLLSLCVHSCGTVITSDDKHSPQSQAAWTQALGPLTSFSVPHFFICKMGCFED